MVERGEGTIERAVALLIAIARTGQRTALSDQAEALHIPLSTAYRMVKEFSRHGLVAPGRRGHFGPGLELVDLARGADPRTILRDAARPPLKRLAREMRMTAHFGVLEEDMVTYIVKERGGGPWLFTQEDSRLEAYCSAIGKVLLAAFSLDQIDTYLNAAPFVALTPHTIIDPGLIRQEIDDVARRGFAVDDREIAIDIQCVAVPVRDRSARVVGAISLSREAQGSVVLEPVPELLQCAKRIESRLGRS